MAVRQARDEYLALCLLEAIADENWSNVQILLQTKQASGFCYVPARQIAAAHYAAGMPSTSFGIRCIELMLQQQQRAPPSTTTALSEPTRMSSRPGNHCIDVQTDDGETPLQVVIESKHHQHDHKYKFYFSPPDRQLSRPHGNRVAAAVPRRLADTNGRGRQQCDRPCDAPRPRGPDQSVSRALHREETATQRQQYRRQQHLHQAGHNGSRTSSSSFATTTTAIKIHQQHPTTSGRAGDHQFDRMQSESNAAASTVQLGSQQPLLYQHHASRSRPHAAPQELVQQ